jgi:hypothetical protein
MWRMKKLNEDEIEEKLWFYKLFQIKQIVMKRKETKYEGKTNWKAVLRI